MNLSSPQPHFSPGYCGDQVCWCEPFCCPRLILGSTNYVWVPMKYHTEGVGS